MRGPPGLPEWKILCGNIQECQKKLNQWRHEYHIKIHGNSFNGVGDLANDLIIILTRIKKEQDNE